MSCESTTTWKREFLAATSNANRKWSSHSIRSEMGPWTPLMRCSFMITLQAFRLLLMSAGTTFSMDFSNLHVQGEYTIQTLENCWYLCPGEINAGNTKDLAQKMEIYHWICLKEHIDHKTVVDYIPLNVRHLLQSSLDCLIFSCSSESSCLRMLSSACASSRFLRRTLHSRLTSAACLSCDWHFASKSAISCDNLSSSEDNLARHRESACPWINLVTHRANEKGRLSWNTMIQRFCQELQCICYSRSSSSKLSDQDGSQFLR